VTLVMGMDQHRAQISAEWIDTITGEVSRARIAPADRIAVRKFLARFDGAVLEVALEATTGWRFLVEEIQRVGAEAHLAESAETAGLKGKKQRAKTDWADARHLRELLLIGRLPESWIAPAHLLDLRARVRCRHTLVHQRTEWQQRMHAVLYHHGVPHARKLLTLANRERVAALKLPAAAHEQLTIAIELQIGPLTSVTILAELGDTRRFQNSRDAVRYGGLDVTVYQSDQHRAAGHLSRQGPPALRWALYEAAQAARRPSSPDRPYYEQLAERIGGNRACVAIARKLLKRSYHVLRGLGDQALEPVTA
jgi:transposase